MADVPQAAPHPAIRNSLRMAHIWVSFGLTETPDVVRVRRNACSTLDSLPSVPSNVYMRLYACEGLWEGSCRLADQCCACYRAWSMWVSRGEQTGARRIFRGDPLGEVTPAAALVAVLVSVGCSQGWRSGRYPYRCLAERKIAYAR